MYCGCMYTWPRGKALSLIEAEIGIAQKLLPGPRLRTRTCVHRKDNTRNRINDGRCRDNGPSCASPGCHRCKGRDSRWFRCQRSQSGWFHSSVIGLQVPVVTLFVRNASVKKTKCVQRRDNFACVDPSPDPNQMIMALISDMRTKKSIQARIRRL